MSSHLFSAFRLRELQLANRIVVSPMAQYSATEGRAAAWHLTHLGNLSISGAGLLIIEATSVERDGRLSPGDLGLWCDENEAALQPVIAFCREHGASRRGAVPEQKIPIKPGYQVPFAGRIRREAGIATMAVGLVTEARQADAIVQSGHADLVAIGRAMLYDPRWPWHAAAELGKDAFYPPQYERAHPSMRRGDFLKASRKS